MSPTEFAHAVDLLAPHMVAVSLCAARLLPVAFLCPLLGGQSAPQSVKLGLVLALALALHVAGGVVPPVSVNDPVTFAGLLVKEIVFGVAMGLVASLPFDAARMGGRFIDMFRGVSAEAALPVAGTRESATGDALYHLVVALAVTGVGFPLVMSALFKSFAVVKLGAFVPTESAAMHIVALAGTALAAGLAVGAPIAGAVMAVDCFVGIASRVAPKMNLGELAAPLKILGGGAVLWLGVGILCERLMAGVLASDSAFETLFAVVGVTSK